MTVDVDETSALTIKQDTETKWLYKWPTRHPSPTPRWRGSATVDLCDLKCSQVYAINRSQIPRGRGQTHWWGHSTPTSLPAPVHCGGDLVTAQRKVDCGVEIFFPRSICSHQLYKHAWVEGKEFTPSITCCTALTDSLEHKTVSTCFVFLKGCASSLRTEFGTVQALFILFFR